MKISVCQIIQKIHLAIQNWNILASSKLLTHNMFNQSMIITESKVHEKSSIYSLAINPPGTILACGSTEKAVGVYSVGVMDTRGPQDIMRLKGHTDNVRALVLNRDGTQVFLTDILCHHPKNIHKICMPRKFHSLPDLKSQFFIWRM